ncbi:hypothetical protein [Fundicoccus culcitae]|uniref:Uncharacterized protein n=1 Tax=Fundicoccus culcitae TaxID=2969821 RepID=A0ABY5P437_9LACT|nr:hypothetical protein [Fundicoccus culcitae]UUX33471.1 hypothetical protein NRE15_11255 [Fundicoccus culcitae]
MKIVDLTIQLGKFDTQTNIKIPFELNQTYTQLTIYFNYSPNKSSDDVAISQLEEAVVKYALPGSRPEDYQVANFLPVDNLITLSLSKNGRYLGAHHNKSNDQTIVISAASASHGFWPVDVDAGRWELQLNCHCVASKVVKANVRIEASL